MLGTRSVTDTLVETTNTETEGVEPDAAIGEPEAKKKMEQSSPDSLTSELRGGAQNDDADDAGNMGDVEQVRDPCYGIARFVLLQYSSLHKVFEGILLFTL